MSTPADQVSIPAISVGVGQAAKTLGVPKTAGYYLIKKGHLPSFKIGKRRLVRIVDLEMLAEKLVRGEVVIPYTEDREEGGA